MEVRVDRRHVIDVVFRISRIELVVVLVFLDQAIGKEPMRSRSHRAERALTEPLPPATETRTGAVEVNGVERRHTCDELKAKIFVSDIDHAAIQLGAEREAVAPEHQIAPELYGDVAGRLAAAISGLEAREIEFVEEPINP